jgi:hypothetical protein
MAGKGASRAGRGGHACQRREARQAVEGTQGNSCRAKQGVNDKTGMAGRGRKCKEGQGRAKHAGSQAG